MSKKYSHVNVKVDQDKKKQVIDICLENNTTLSREVRKLVDKILKENAQGVLNL